LNPLNARRKVNWGLMAVNTIPGARYTVGCRRWSGKRRKSDNKKRWDNYLQKLNFYAFMQLLGKN